MLKDLLTIFKILMKDKSFKEKIINFKATLLSEFRKAVKILIIREKSQMQITAKAFSNNLNSNNKIIPR